MAIRRRGSSWQVDVVAGGKRYREACRTEELAIQREAELRLAAVRGQEVSPSVAKAGVKLTLGELLDRCLADERHGWKGSKSEGKTAQRAGLVVDYFGRSKLVAEITTEDVDHFVADLEKAGNSNATINRKLAALSKMLRFAKRKGYLRETPVMERKREGQGRERFLTGEEEARLLATLRVWGLTDVHDYIVFLIDTGCRASEALKLTWKDVKGRHVTFWDTKNGLPRTIPLTTRLQALLEARRRSHGRPFDLTYDSIHAYWDKVRTHMGLAEDKQFVLHMLRHTCASRLAQAGADLLYLKKWLGHKTLNQTMRYAHLVTTDLDRIVGLLEPAPASHLRVTAAPQA